MFAAAVSAQIVSDDAGFLVDSAVVSLGLFYTSVWHVGPLLAAGRLDEVLPGFPSPITAVVTADPSDLPSRLLKKGLEWR